LAVTAQTKISGKVIGSDDKQPIIGATVKIKGTNVGVVTDVNGNFTLTGKTGYVLVISYIGYAPKTVTVNSADLGTITLDVTNSTLNEVVVTGYQSQRKKDIASSVAIVNVADAKKIPTGGSTDQLLQGQAAGVTVVTQGQPGGGSAVFVRGISNLDNSQPLYVIDGVQGNNMSTINPNDIESIQVLKDAGATAIYGVNGGNGVIIITTKHGKAGASTISYDAYYGTQVPKGGNVFNILSPSGMSSLSYLAGDGSVYNKIYQGGAGTLPVYGYQGVLPSGASASGVAGGTGYPAVPADLLADYHFDPTNAANDFLVQKFNQSGTDWFHELFKAAPEQYHTVTASGANDKNNYYLSVGYLDQQGTEAYTYYKRYETRINTTFNILKNLRVGESGFFYYTLSPEGGTGAYPGQGGLLNQNEGDPISETYREMPQIPVYDISGKQFGGDYDGPGGEPLGNASNPVAAAYQFNNQLSRNWNIQGNVYAELDFLKHFTAHISMGGNIDNYYYNDFSTPAYMDYESHGNPNTVSEGAGYYSNYNWTNTVKYAQTFGKHNLTAMVGFEQLYGYGRYIYGNGASLFSTAPAYVNLSNATATLTRGSAADQPLATQSFFGSIDYIYNDKYILRATIRRDGYSAFYPGVQWGTFPSVSAAWRISQEDFLKSVTWINDLKIRGSWGEAGNNKNVGGGNAYDLFNSALGNGDYAINGGNGTSQGFYYSNVGNQKTTWETDKTLDFGFDATLFNHFDITFDWYRKTISGLLFAASLPATVGLGDTGAPQINLGDVQNNGFDLAIDYRNSVGNDFKYHFGINITKYTNKITSLPGNYIDDAGNRVNDIVRDEVGHPIGEFYGYKVIGFYNTNEFTQDPSTKAWTPNPGVVAYAGAQPGSFRYADVNGDGQVNDADRTFIGNPNPDFTYGINLGASYKNFDLGAVLYGSYGNQVYNYTLYWTDFYGSFNGAKSNDALHNSFGAPGVTNPLLPIQSDLNTMGTTQTSSFYVQNASFLKVRTIQLGYTFDPKIIKTIGMSKLRIYLQATNPFTFTPYNGLDPELPPGTGRQSSFGIDEGNYPNNQRQYIVGVNLTF
jgi:TonB-linked SusC/RagA family outer membrane protein